MKSESYICVIGTGVFLMVGFAYPSDSYFLGLGIALGILSLGLIGDNLVDKLRDTPLQKEEESNEQKNNENNEEDTNIS